MLFDLSVCIWDFAGIVSFDRLTLELNSVCRLDYCVPSCLGSIVPSCSAVSWLLC